MTQYMLMFSLGPVQLFIEQARKTRDLWLGSFLLSTLMEAGMKGIEESSLVFPTKPTIENNIPDLPNKFVATFDTLTEARDTAKRTRDQIEQCWIEICQDIWRRIIEEHARFSTTTTREIWERQTNPANFFEIFWVVVEGDPELYDQWLQRTQEALDARKQLRDFRPQNEPGEKSTISGERQALRGVGASRLDVQTFWYELTKDLPEKDISKDGTERLDAIDTIKRFATLSTRLQAKHLQADFPSTSTVATASFVEKLIEKTPGLESLSSATEDWLKATTKPFNEMPTGGVPYLKRQADKQKQMLEVLRRDGDCYFLETFTQNRLKKDYGFSLSNEDERQRTQQCATNVQKALKALLGTASDSTIPRPTPYYAILQMDGDRMGHLLNGVKDRSAHVLMSNTLSRFARGVVPPIVEGNRPGRLVYAGGDDVLAFSPLENLLDLADRLQSEYRSNISKVVAEDRQAEATASTGIAIANHLTPLSAVLRATREAEKLAKNRYSRNALVVTLMRRSGEQTRVGCHWRYRELGADDDPRQPIKLFSRFYDLFDQDILSPKCVFTLLEEAATLIGLLPEAQVSEIKRVLLRQREIKKRDMLPDAEVARLAENVVAVAAAMDTATDRENEDTYRSTELHADELRHGLIETLGWLLVMVFLTRKEQD